MLTVLAGFAFGFLGSMPVAGPIAVLVLRLGLNHDARHARLVAFGGALAESGYALLAFWGLSTVLDRYPMILPASKAVGAVVGLALGLVLLRYRSPQPKEPPPAQTGRRRGSKRSFFGGFLITALNPAFLVTWTAALAALHATGVVKMTPDRAVPFALAACLGIIAWFSVLLWLVRRFKGAFRPAAVERLVRVFGVLLVVGSLWVGVGTWRHRHQPHPATAGLLLP